MTEMEPRGDDCGDDCGDGCGSMSADQRPVGSARERVTTTTTTESNDHVETKCERADAMALSDDGHEVGTNRDKRVCFLGARAHSALSGREEQEIHSEGEARGKCRSSAVGGSVRADLGARAHSALSGREVSARATQAKQEPLDGRSENKENKINERTNKGGLNEESEEGRTRASECVCVCGEVEK